MHLPHIAGACSFSIYGNLDNAQYYHRLWDGNWKRVRKNPENTAPWVPGLLLGYRSGGSSGVPSPQPAPRGEERALPSRLTLQRLPEEAAPVVGGGEEAPGGAEPGCEGCALRNTSVSPARSWSTSHEQFPFVAGTSPSQGVCAHFPWIWEVPQNSRHSFLPFFNHGVIPPTCTPCILPARLHGEEQGSSQP